MADKMEVYKCAHCGIIAQVLHGGVGKLICCGEPMALMNENSVDASKEKHVPVGEKADGSIKVSIGSIPHPMEETHYIEWVEIIIGDKSCRKFLSPGDTPEVTFNCGCVECDMTVRAYCNLHGLWRA